MEIIETNLEFKDMSTRKSTERIILHHADAKNCSAEDIHRWHLGNGWSGAGYHFLVKKMVKYIDFAQRIKWEHMHMVQITIL